MSKIINLIRRTKFKYLLTRSIVKGDIDTIIRIHTNTKIYNSKITVKQGGSLIIGKDCVIRNLNLLVEGTVNIGNSNLIDNGNSPSINITIANGNFNLGDFNRINSRILIRFGGSLTIGNHNNINDGTEIRADEKISVGDYNQISYNCVIWDTNTHNMYADAKRRELTNIHFPVFGFEFEKPKTKPIKIENDCWVGRGASILKGVTLNNSSIVGYNTTLSNCIIEERKIVVSKIENTIFERNI